MARGLYDAFGRGDVDALVALVDPRVEWELVGPREIPYFGAYRGPQEVRRFLGRWRTTARSRSARSSP